MIAFSSLFQNLPQSAVWAARSLAMTLASLDHQPVAATGSTVAGFALSAGLIGLSCVYGAYWMRTRSGQFALRPVAVRADAATQFRDALLQHGTQSILVLGSGKKEPRYFGEARAQLQACEAGQDSPALAQALASLIETGASFALSARTPDDRLLAVRGLPLGGRAVLYFEEERRDVSDFGEILDALPMPVWLHEKNRSMTWANSAFLRAAGVASLAHLPADGSEWAAPSAWTPADGKPVEIQRNMTVAGERRTFALNLLPLHNEAVAGVALDITPSTKTETRLGLELDAQIDMMEHFFTPIAMFDAEQHLVRYNTAYAQLWELPEAWLDLRPSRDEIFDRLRDSRKLPEQRNFTEWKQTQSRLFEDLNGPTETQWHLPGGKSLRVVVQPHLLGGIFVQFEDISEKLRLEAAATLLTQVQRGTLDTIDDGMAIFATDGRLVLHNSRFAKMWGLSEDELSLQPHFAEIANLCTSRIGRDGIWGIVSWGVNSAAPESLNEWGQARRADGKLISLALSRLPNGATVVKFADITDLERFSAGANLAADNSPHHGQSNGPSFVTV